MEFYTCDLCHQVSIKLGNHHEPMGCCGEEMTCLEASQNPTLMDQHKVIFRKTGSFLTISIGEEHPMIDVHHIQFIVLVTNQGFQYKELYSMSVKKANFILAEDESIKDVYVYCNIHALIRLNLATLNV